MTSPNLLERQASQHVARLHAEAHAIRRARESRTPLANRIAATLRTWAERLDDAQAARTAQGPMAERQLARQQNTSANAARLTH